MEIVIDEAWTVREGETAAALDRAPGVVQVYLYCASSLAQQTGALRDLRPANCRAVWLCSRPLLRFGDVLSKYCVRLEHRL